MTKIDNLQNRLDRIGGSNVWVPQWLLDVGSADEIAEWKAIFRSYRGRDLADRRDEFIRTMRQRHPNMAKGFEEQMWEGVEKLKADPELRRREGITEEMEKEFDEEGET